MNVNGKKMKQGRERYLAPGIWGAHVLTIKPAWSIWVVVSKTACLKKDLVLKISSINLVTRDAELVTQHQITVPINSLTCTEPCAWIGGSENADNSVSGATFPTVEQSKDSFL